MKNKLRERERESDENGREIEEGSSIFDHEVSKKEDLFQETVSFTLSICLSVRVLHKHPFISLHLSFLSLSTLNAFLFISSDF
jgi:hypothetical protein